jgi:tRNA(fMet)-specific endonuclease VapC
VRRTLDTNICSYVLRKRPVQMVERFRQLDRRQLWLSAIVAAELRFGAEKLGSSRFRGSVEAWLSGFELRDWPLAATHHYARLRAQLEAKGTPVGNLDLMIAAHALAEDSVVITNNAREFHRIPGVAVEEWQLD